MQKRIEILETPRDAMQGMNRIIPTTDKVKLFNALLRANFDILDIGSFVNPAIIPQFADMDDILNLINKQNSSTRLFVLVANEKGALRASQYSQIDILGFPFSTSAAFLQRNINIGIDDGWQRIYRINDICKKSDKQLMVYLAMAFGNPYGDETSVEILLEFTKKLAREGIKQISLSDIIGVAKPAFIGEIYKALSYEFPDISFGMHLHVHPSKGQWEEKLQAAFLNGCNRFDGVINGMGGCPMTGYGLLGNLPTGNILTFANKQQIKHQVDLDKFKLAGSIANVVFKEDAQK